MILTRIEIHKFKMMLFGGIEHLEIDVTGPIQCIIGNNGCGKSTLLTQLHPFPATSTDYESGGYKQLHFTDGEDTYLIRSEFNKKEIKHSFIRNGIELNESFTSGVQTELACRYFDLRDSTKLLLQGSLDFCTMAVSTRKSFIFGCYPSDLSFLMDHYKKINTELRSVKSNIKLMVGRQAELEGSLIPEEAYALLQLKLERLLETREALLKQQTIFQQQLEHLVQSEHFDTAAPKVTLTELSDLIYSFQRKAGSLKRKYLGLTSSAAQQQVHVLTYRQQTLKQQELQVHHDITKLLQEINRFETLSKELADTALQQHEEHIHELQQQLQQITLDPTVQSIPYSIANAIDLNRVSNCISSFPEGMLSQTALSTLRIQLNTLIEQKQQVYVQIETLQNERTYLKEQVEHSSWNSFKTDCTEECPARRSSKERHGELTTRYEKVIQELTELYKQSKQLIFDIERIEATLEHATSYQSGIRWLLQHLESYGVTEDSLITEPMVFLNRLIRQVNASRLKHQAEELNTTLQHEQRTLATLKQARLEKQQLVSTFEGNQYDRIEQLRAQYDSYKKEQQTVYDQLQGYQALAHLDDEFNELDAYITQTVTTTQLNLKYEWIQQALEELEKLVGQVDRMLLDTRNTLKSQESLRIRISEEIVPTLKSLQEEEYNLLQLEQILSPVTGMSNTYISRYMNQVLHYANLVLHRIWNYDFTLQPLDETKTFDYTFSVRLHHRGTVPDIKLLSRSQQEVCNLAFMFGWFIVNKLGDRYPLKLDEIDSGMTPHHRTMLLSFLSELMDSGKIKQLFLVNHHSTLFSGLPEAQINVLDEEGIVLPNVYNEHVKIIRV